MVSFSFAKLVATTALLGGITSAAPTVGSTLQLLFLNTTAQPLTAYVQKAVPNGPTTYIINCLSQDAADCTIHSATLTVDPGLAYDFHKSVNEGGAMTIHCDYKADGSTPASCTTTVAGGPDGYEVSTAAPSEGQWAYLPVQVVATPSDSGAYAGATVDAPASTSSRAPSTMPGASATFNGEEFTGAGNSQRAEMSLVFGCIMLMLMAQIGFFS